MKEHFQPQDPSGEHSPPVADVLREGRGKALTLLYEVKPGPSRASFGIACAEIAGFPPAVVADAARRAAALERRAPSS